MSISGRDLRRCWLAVLSLVALPFAATTASAKTRVAQPRTRGAAARSLVAQIAKCKAQWCKIVSQVRGVSLAERSRRQPFRRGNTEFSGHQSLLHSCDAGRTDTLHPTTGPCLRDRRQSRHTSLFRPRGSQTGATSKVGG
jgi:hypothetical protein